MSIIDAVTLTTMTDLATPRIIVGAVIVLGGKVLAGERTGPQDMVGRWEFPGGAVEPGETEQQAVARECVEELGVVVDVGDRVGMDATIRPGKSILRVYAATVRDQAEPRPMQQQQLRWLSIDELGTVPWLPADAAVVADVAALLRFAG